MNGTQEINGLLNSLRNEIGNVIINFEDRASESFRHQYPTGRFLPSESCVYLPAKPLNFHNIRYNIGKNLFEVNFQVGTTHNFVSVSLERFDELVERGSVGILG